MINALDDSFSKDEELEILIQILQEDVPLLALSVRFFVSSCDAGYLRSLKQDTHFHPFHLDIRGESNLIDIRTFARQALRKVAKLKGYTRDWPGVKVEEEPTKKAEGLFVWIATMMRLLSTTSLPDKKLRALLFGE